MKNNDLRAEMMKHGLYLYQVAAAMNIKPNTLSHYLMWDLSKPQKQRIMQGIARAKGNVTNGKAKEESI